VDSRSFQLSAVSYQLNLFVMMLRWVSPDSFYSRGRKCGTPEQQLSAIAFQPSAIAAGLRPRTGEGGHPHICAWLPADR